MYGGDGFWMFADPTDPEYIYAEYQGGGIARINRKTHETSDIKPLPSYGEKKLRFNWSAPIHLSPTQKGTVYLGAQYLFRSRDRGQTWERVSPDLTTNDPEKQKQEQSGGVTVDNPAAETHPTIYAIAESPKNPAVIWVGTDDGNVQVTRDGGKTWKNVVGNVRGVPQNAWVSYIDAGRFEDGLRHLRRAHFGDMKPYVHRTTDFGQTWTPLIAASSPVRGYAHVVRQDLVNRDLLFVGTEFGLWVSLDGGRLWAQYKGGGLPSVAVRDLVIHPRDHDLVVGTHGRGIWIIDDITPRRALTPEGLTKDVFFTEARPSVQSVSGGGGWPIGDAEFVGPNPTGEAVVTYYQRRRHIFGDLKIEIFDPAGKLLGTIPSSKRRGLNRVTWPMRLNPPKVPTAATAAFGAAVGPRVLPGEYTVRMTKDKNVYTTRLRVVADPRSTHTAEDRRRQYDLALKLHGTLGEMSFAVERINGLRLALDDRAAKLASGDSLRKRLTDASARLDELRKKIVATKEGGAITGEERLREFLTELYANVNSYEGRPSQTQVERSDALARELSDVVGEFDARAAKEVSSLNAELKGRNLEPLRPVTREEWEKAAASRPASASSPAAMRRGRE